MSKCSPESSTKPYQTNLEVSQQNSITSPTFSSSPISPSTKLYTPIQDVVKYKIAKIWIINWIPIVWKLGTLSLTHKGLVLETFQKRIHEFPYNSFCFVISTDYNSAFTIVDNFNRDLCYIRVYDTNQFRLWKEALLKSNIPQRCDRSVLEIASQFIIENKLVPKQCTMSQELLTQKSVTQWNMEEVQLWLSGMYYFDPSKGICCLRNIFGQLFLDKQIDGIRLLQLFNFDVARTFAKQKQLLLDRIQQLRKNGYCTNSVKVWSKITQLESSVVQKLYELLGDFEILGNVKLMEMYLKTLAMGVTETKFTVKLVVTEMLEKSKVFLRRLASPFAVKLPDFSTTFGLFHVALLIGPWYIEWNDSSTCIPRRASSKGALISIDLGVVDKSKSLSVIANEIVKYNVNYSYFNLNASGLYANCQHFVEALLLRLNISLTAINSVVFQFLELMKRKGVSDMRFIPNSSLKNTLKLNAKYIFKTHKQLDLFVNNLLITCPSFQMDYKDEWSLLKAFDRAFWLRDIAVGTTNSNCSCPFGNN